jgi:sec-independent protein translocase protein TatA
MSPLFAIFGVGPVELLVVGGVVLLLFGNRLPGLMRSVGRSVVEFKKGVNEIENSSEDVDEDTKTPSGKP